MSDKATFRAIIGVGPKLAERIIIELRDKIKDLTLHSAPYGDDSKLTSAIASDAIAALVNLGINRIEAYNLVSAIMHLNQEIQIEDLIKLALQTRSNIDLQNHK
jgi:Holliday junction DNA helicase RuvA